MSNHSRLEVYHEGKPQLSSDSFARGLDYVRGTSTDMMLRIVDRIGLEDRGIPVRNVPIGGSSRVDDLFEVFDKARQGFRFLSRNVGEGIDPGKFIQAVGTSSKDEAAKFINEMFPPGVLSRPNDEFALSVFLAFQSTLFRLSQRGTVNFYLLGLTPSDDPKLILDPSYWQYNLSSEKIWDIIKEVETVTREAICNPGLLQRKAKTLQAAHFFGATLSLRI